MNKALKEQAEKANNDLKKKLNKAHLEVKRAANEYGYCHPYTQSWMRVRDSLRNQIVIIA